MSTTLRSVVAGAVLVVVQDGQPPADGLQPIFNGRDLTGWHVSETSPHGRTRAWHVEDGAIVGMQQPEGEGGILLTNERYGNVEISLEVLPDFGCDSGLFLRSSERGEAYQVMLDYVDGEQLEGIDAPPNPQWERAWRRGDWNRLRVRITGAIPHITVWLNGTLISDWTDTANHAAGRAVTGAIALQVHGGGRWRPGGKIRFRNIAVRALP